MERKTSTGPWEGLLHRPAPRRAVPSSTADRSAARLLAFRHCAGFRVESADGHIGFVEDVLFGSDPERPSALAIRSGLFSRHVDLVALEDIEEVVPNERRIRLRAPRADGVASAVSGGPYH
jgi:hypothetical protein